jgi:hypothetical protein
MLGLNSDTSSDHWSECMSGTKPTKATIAQHMMSAGDGSHIIVREFRGAQLALVSYDGRGGFLWRNVMLIDDKAPALRMPHAFALRLADKASREYGAKCATLSADGTLTQPARAVTPSDRLLGNAYKLSGTMPELMNALSKLHPGTTPALLAEALHSAGKINHAERALIVAAGFEFDVE